jgi:general secretion pathway protein H
LGVTRGFVSRPGYRSGTAGTHPDSFLRRSSPGVLVRSTPRIEIPTQPARRHRRPLRRAGQRSGSYGFTLLELLLALVLAALLMAIAAPNFAPLLARAQLYSATRDVASALRHARGQALVRGRDAEFELDVDRHRYRVTGRAKTYGLPSPLHLSLFTAETETVDEGTGRIRFFPDGSATGGRVTLEGDGQKRVVDVNWLTGEVKIREDADED